MEKNSNHSSKDQPKTSEKMLGDSNKDIMSFYTQQLNVATSFYKNLFDSFSTGKTGWNNAPDFLNNDFTKAFSMPYSGLTSNLANPFMPTFDKLFKQLSDYNTTMFTNLTNGFGVNTDMSEISKTYQDTIATRIESYMSFLKTANEAFGKQLEYSVDSNKKAMEDMNTQFQLMVEQNQNLWADLLAASRPAKDNTGKPGKDSISPELKKRTSVPASELSNHKV
jgi:hypothetical protein